MSQERADRQDRASGDWRKNQKIKSEETQEIKLISLADVYPLDCQNNSFSEDFEFPLSLSRWSYFNRGLFWGFIFGFTALFSASCGIALTRIDAVEKAIGQTFNLNSPSLEAEVKPSLSKPVNLLLLEVEPKQELKNKFSQEFVGENQTILLLQFRPQENIVRIINIPPDNRVEIPGFGWGTIADAHRYGGVALVARTISQTTNGIAIQRYVKGTSRTFDKLIASGKIALNNCNLVEIEECSNPQERVSRQKKAIETIRQRFNIPTYFRSFEITLAKNKSDLDTNLSLPEAVALANFIKELETEEVVVSLVAGYTAGDSHNIDRPLHKSKSIAKTADDFSQDRTFSFKHRPIAVQNTTDSPELGMRVVDYLRNQNFQDVYLVEHIPLRLNKTEIIISGSQLARAKHLKQVMGFGVLEPESNNRQTPLTVRVGEDAIDLPLYNLNF